VQVSVQVSVQVDNAVQVRYLRSAIYFGTVAGASSKNLPKMCTQATTQGSRIGVSQACKYCVQDMAA
jgi:hypothetical protein